MKALSYTQEYFLCAVNDKGNPKSLKSDEVTACLLVGGIAELTERGFIARDEKKRFVIVKPWDDSLPYLKPLYETVASFKKPKDIKRIADSYLLGSNLKRPAELMAAIGASLAKANCADELTDQGMLKNKTKYAPKPEAVTRVIEKVRAEFLEDGVVTDETLYLASFLDKSGFIRDYFSKVEKETLKKCIKEVRKSEAFASAKEVLDELEAMYAVIVVMTVAGT